MVPDQGNWGTVVSMKFPVDSSYPSNGVLYLSGVTVQRTYAIDYYFTVQQECMVVLPYVADLGQCVTLFFTLLTGVLTDITH